MVFTKSIAKKEFRTKEYRSNAEHIARISQAAFNRTPLDDLIQNASNNFSSIPSGNLLEVIYSTFGDPARYPGIGTHRGYKRAEQMCVSFLGSDRSNGYVPGGNEQLKFRLVGGYTRGPDGNKTLPPEVGVYITPGVAGALRLLCDAMIFPPAPSFLSDASHDLLRSLEDKRSRSMPPTPEDINNAIMLSDECRRMSVRSNVVIPLWTYPSHLAEVFRAHGEVQMCGITSEGQVDLTSLEKAIGPHTRAVIFATVGNPLCTAMEPEQFDNILEVVQKKMDEFKRPILVVADTIYEHFRRDTNKRLDPIRRAANLGLGVWIAEVSSFSKMMVIPGARIGYLRHYLPADSYPAHRHDFLRSLELLYWPTLCPVATQPQLALGELYASINRNDPIEENLAPLAAMLTAIKELSDSGGKVLKLSIFTFDEVQARLSEKGVPDGFFTSSAVAGQTRRIANKQLQGYKVDIDHDNMAELIERAEKAGIIKVQRKGPEVYLKLEKPDVIPPVDRSDDGQLVLYGISKNDDWCKLANMCGIKTETEAYEEHKDYIRRTMAERTDYLVDRLLDVPGVQLHPALVGPDGLPIRDRFNSFYALWGFEGLMPYDPHMFQATRIGELCIKNRQPVIATVPGEMFLTPEVRPTQPSYVRQVTLTTREVTDRIIEVLKRISREAAR